MSTNPAMELMGLFEIAQLASVSVQAVSNWTSRKASFPKPVTVLASGPVWDGEVVRAWLRQERGALLAPSKGKQMNQKSQLVVGKEYSLAEVQLLIGGDTMSYLPQTGGRIVGGRFKKGAMNPRAPYEVLVGDLPMVRRKAELMAEQGGSIPVFLKQDVNRWLFHGRMRLVSYRTDMATIEKGLTGSERDDAVVGVLRFADES
jgi:hypothetical protein